MNVQHVHPVMLEKQIAYELTPNSGVYRLKNHHLAVICQETGKAVVIEAPLQKIKEQ